MSDLPAGVTVDWPTESSASLDAEVHALLAAVVGAGGAVGWLHVPDESEAAGWFNAELALVAAGRAGIPIVRYDGRLAALAVWARFPGAVVAHNAEVRKVMVHPELQGRGLGRVVMEVVAASAKDAGVENLVLDVRGNNHGAQALYESLGWQRQGALPDFVAVGEHRFDRVLYSLALQRAAGAISHGCRVEGPGASTRRS